MSVQLRILLAVGALSAFLFVARNIRKNKIRMEDAVFWVVLSVLLLVVALVPQIAIRCAALIGFISASNFVFLVIVGLLLMKLFSLSAEVSRLKFKVESLVQEEALTRHERMQ